MGFRKRSRTEERALRMPFNVGGWDGTATDFAHIGQRIDPDNALRLSAVWSCVRLLADTISTFPVDVFRTAGTSTEQVPAPPLFASPAAGLSLPEWLYEVVVSLLLRGNAYGLITARTGAAMRPAQIEIVNPDRMTVTINPDGRTVYRLDGNEIDPADIWHVKAYPFPGSPTGLSPITYAAHTIGIGLAANRFAGQWFEEGAHPTGILATEANLSAEQASSLKRMFVHRTRGTREPIVLGNGVSYQPIQVNPEDAQLLEVQRFTVNEIARVFGVPPEMIAGESGNSLTYANVEGRALDFLRYSVNPWLVRLEGALGQLLPRGTFAKFNPNALLRSTTAERYAAHEIGLRAGFLTVNEVRALEDLPALEQGMAA